MNCQFVILVQRFLVLSSLWRIKSSHASTFESDLLEMVGDVFVAVIGRVRHFHPKCEDHESVLFVIHLFFRIFQVTMDYLNLKSKVKVFPNVVFWQYSK